MTLHIYAQELWHDEAYIAGTREDLEMLRMAIDRALTEEHGQMQAFACDGEGYTVHVVVATEDQADAMPVPYTDECARAQQDRMQFGPWTLMRSNAEVSGCLRAPMPEDAPRTAAGSPLDRPVGPVAGA